MPKNKNRIDMGDPEQDRREDIVKTVLRYRSLPVAQIAEHLRKRYGEVNEIAAGDELYPTETTWYFNAPKAL